MNLKFVVYHPFPDVFKIHIYYSEYNRVQKFFENAYFSVFLGIYGLIPPPPTNPHINVKKCYFCVAWTGIIKITNIDMGEWGKKWGNGGNITGDRSRDVFQNIFAHDCLDFKSVTIEL